MKTYTITIQKAIRWIHSPRKWRRKRNYNNILGKHNEEAIDNLADAIMTNEGIKSKLGGINYLIN